MLKKPTGRFGLIVRRTMILVALIIALLAATLYVIAYTPTGSNPEGTRLAKIEASEQYNPELKQLQNSEAIPLSTGRPWTRILYEYFTNGEERRPGVKLPEITDGLAQFDSKSRQARFIWLGHSTILLDIDKTRILIDPVFSDYASPVPGIAERFQPPVYRLDDIRNIDLVLISHDHYDHLDHKTIEKLKRRNLHYVTPLGVGAHLEFWGISPGKITELDWWESTTFNGLTLTGTPSQHFSGRGMLNRNTTLWSSWVIQGIEQRLFFSGDSGYAHHYQAIGDRFGPFDLAFLENGAYSIDWKFVHQLPEEGVQAALDLKARTMIPVHWGMFDLAMHSWHEPIERVMAEAKRRGVSILAPQIGQAVSVHQAPEPSDWWSSLIGLTGTARSTP